MKTYVCCVCTPISKMNPCTLTVEVAERGTKPFICPWTDTLVLCDWKLQRTPRKRKRKQRKGRR